MPVIKRWGRVWQIIGIVGTAVFVVLYFSSRFHLLPEGNILGGMTPGNIPQREFPRGNMTGDEFPRGGMPRDMGFGLFGNALAIEVCQIVFIGLYVVLGKINSRRQKKMVE